MIGNNYIGGVSIEIGPALEMNAPTRIEPDEMIAPETGQIRKQTTVLIEQKTIRLKQNRAQAEKDSRAEKISGKNNQQESRQELSPLVNQAEVSTILRMLSSP